MKTRALMALTALAAGSLTVGIGGGPASAAPTVVFEIPGGGWTSDPFHTGTVSFVAGPPTPPLGTGSMQMSVADGNQRALIRYDLGSSSQLSALGGGWSTYRPAGSVVGAPPALKFVGSLTGSTIPVFQTTTINFEPYQQSEGLPAEGWKTWVIDDADLVWRTGGGAADPCRIATPCTFAAFKSAYPAANFRFVQLGVGALGGNAPATGNVDAVQVTVGGTVVVDTDFEPPPPPTALNDDYGVVQDTVLEVSDPAGVLLNDVGPAGHLLQAALVANPTNGTVTLRPDGGFTYTPTAGFVGIDTFTYQATDTVTTLVSGVATVTIDVTSSAEVLPPIPPVGATTSMFTSLAPARVVDTRIGLGAAAKLAAGAVTDFTVAGVGGVPASGVTAVAVNIAATEPQAPGFIQAFPTGAGTIGASSSVNVDHAGQTISNFVVVGVDTSGRFSVFTQSATHLVIDVLGYFTAVPTATAGRLVTVDPVRVLDTRAGIGSGGATTPVPALGSLDLVVTGAVPADAAAVVMSLAADQALAPGYVQAIPTGGATALGASANINVDRAGETMSNTVVVPIGAGGSVTLFSQSGAHLVADVVGYFTGASAPSTTAGLFVPIAPLRFADSRVTGDLIAAGETFVVPVEGRDPVPPITSAVAGSLAATDTTASGYVQLIPTGATTPIGGTATLNINGAGRIVAAGTILSTASGSVTVHSQTTTHLVYDVTGYFL